MIKSKKKMYIIIGLFIFVLCLFTTTYAFFNYTRTGSSNVVKMGRINFNATQSGTLTLTNVFPISSNSVGNDYTENTLKIAITGDTTYSEGIEYLVTAEDVNVTTTNDKKVPLTLKVDVTDNLGTEDTDVDEIEYFTDRGGNTSYYKLLSESVLYEGQYLLVGYIASGNTGINGTINIKAYLDEDKVLISDTYDGFETDEYGTPRSMASRKTVLTTEEWNYLNETGHELSFKIKVEANEGVWVEPSTTINSVGYLNTEILYNVLPEVTEIHFIRETPIRLQKRYNEATVKDNITDTTLNEGQVLAWREGDILYVASTGETYLPENSSGFFGGRSNLEKIVFENVNTSRVTNMSNMFASCSSLVDIDLTSFDTSNVTSMYAMFVYCTGLVNVNLENLGSDNLTNIGSIFNSCTNIESINMRNFNFGNTTSISQLFFNLAKLEKLDITGINTSNVQNMSQMFDSCQKITDLDLSNIDMSSVTNMYAMFRYMRGLKTLNLNGGGSQTLGSTADTLYGCINLEYLYMRNFNFGGTSLSTNGGFGSLGKVKFIDLSNSNMSGVSGFFGAFEGCNELEILDLSGVTVPSTSKTVQNMFLGCSKLKTIYVTNSIDLSNYVSYTSNLNNTSNMFKGCTSLVGGQGTTYDSNYTDVTYAHIDGGTSNPGYFTLKTD